jgi:N-acetylmuramoyl-L-alanine amidase CwlA
MSDQLQTPTSPSQITQPPASIFSTQSINAPSGSSWLNVTAHNPSACVKDCTFQDGQSRLYHWTKCAGTTYVGIIHVVIDKATNKTITSTSSYKEEYTYFLKDQTYTAALSDLVSNGRALVLTRTDVNAAGTVTQVVTGEGSPP